MINGLNSDYYDLNGLRDMRIDYLNDSKGEYFEDVESNIQDQINNLSTEHGGNYNLVQQYAITLSGNVNNYYYYLDDRINELDTRTTFISQYEDGVLINGTTLFDRITTLWGNNYLNGGTTYINNIDVIPYINSISGAVWSNYKLEQQNYNLNNQYEISLSDKIYYNYQIDGYQYNLNNQYEISLSNKIYSNYRLDGYQYNLNNQYSITLSSYVNSFYFNYGENITSINSNISSLWSGHNSQAGQISDLYDRTDANESTGTGNSIGLGLLGLGTAGMGVAAGVSLITLQGQIAALNTTVLALSNRLLSAEYKILELQNKVNSLTNKTKTLVKNDNDDTQITADFSCVHEIKLGAKEGSSFGNQITHILGDAHCYQNLEVEGDIIINGGKLLDKVWNCTVQWYQCEL